MSNWLEDLEIQEISLVDRPANSEVINGVKVPRARIALFKRDDTADTTPHVKLHSITTKIAHKEFHKPMTFEEIIKSATTRSEIARAVRAEALSKVEKRDNKSIEIQEAKVWAHPGVTEQYDSLPVAKCAPQVQQRDLVTAAEIELNKRAIRVAKRDNLSYAQAASKVLNDDPSLYLQYCDEKSNGEAVYMPVTKAGNYSRDVEDSPEDQADGGDDEDTELEDCPDCKGTGKFAGKKCLNCGGSGDVVVTSKTAKMKKQLLKKLDDIDAVITRVTKLEAALKSRK